MKIEFYVRYGTNFGEQIFLSGNTNLLGAGEEAAALKMEFLNHEFWHASIEIDPEAVPELNYHYILVTHHGERIHEGERDRQIHFERDKELVTVVDSWNPAGQFENAFYTAPFSKVYFKQKSSRQKKQKSKTHSFRVKAPLLQAGEGLCITGNAAALGNWEQADAVPMERQGEWWVLLADLSNATFPVAYKYAVTEAKNNTIIRFEEGDNRLIEFGGLANSSTILHDGFVRLPNNTWKAAGVAIPVFSLRTENGFGVGEFSDIETLADWAAGAGIRLIQLLPVNDTSARLTWEDSYPYAAISAFALHPIYINLEKVAGKKYHHLVKALNKKKKQLNALPELDYEKVMQFKMQMLRELYAEMPRDFMREDEFSSFFRENAHWLTPYAVFSHLRDKNGTAEFGKWKSMQVYDAVEAERLASAKTKTGAEIRFYYLVQYHLHLQLKAAADYAQKKGIALKGDIPIGIYRHSVDAWTEPELYHMNWQAGAPPDDFAVKGQNWGFPTYNWAKMQDDHFEWWKRRFRQMSSYFDAFRIDHILGFFRIWSIPLDAVEGILGRFVPAIPVHVNELGERGIWFEYDRFCKPYITDPIVNERFGEHADFVRNNFLEAQGNGRYNLREAFNTQQKIGEAFEHDPEGSVIRDGLYDLVSNVILLPIPGNDDAFHFRISMEQTSSYQHFDEATKQKLKDLYVNYFYHRQDEFWKEEALKKLPSLKRATRMLICGEDLGMVPHCVPDVMQDLGILSLEIQRMPKNPKTEFFLPSTAPYLAVITPSTHDMSTIRGWWEESRERTQRFYNQVLETSGTAPYFCESWINRAIILQHLYSPAMWSIFQMQDLLGMNDELRRQDPREERINQPADPKHYWRYRMHITLEQLQKEKAFNNELKEYITHSGR